jgi:hypothetical protein
MSKIIDDWNLIPNIYPRRINLDSNLGNTQVNTEKGAPA